jgi:hypothetical protein
MCLQGRKDPLTLVSLEIKEDAEIETLPFISDSREGNNLLKVLKRAQNMCEVRDITRKYVYGDQGTEKMPVIVEQYRKRVVGALINAVRFSKMLHTQR